MPTMRTIGKSWRQERRKTQIAQSVPDQWNKKNREASPPLDFGRSTSSSKVQRLRYQLFGELPVSCRCLFRITRRFYCTFYYRSSSSKSHQISRRLWRTLCLVALVVFGNFVCHFVEVRLVSPASFSFSR